MTINDAIKTELKDVEQAVEKLLLMDLRDNDLLMTKVLKALCDLTGIVNSLDARLTKLEEGK